MSLTETALALGKSPAVKTLFTLALEEDLGPGDVTSLTLVPADRRARAELVCKESGILCGLPLVEALIRLAKADLTLEARIDEGREVSAGMVCGVLEGSARDLLALERTALNVLQRLSGIATTTRRYVDAIARHPCAILETRKTVPGWRTLDKYAVLAGGGTNHRMGLFDQILAKENHFALAGHRGDAFREAVATLVERRPAGIPVEVEVETLDQLDAALDAGVDIVLLDNMSLEEMRTAVKRRNARDGRAPRLEASGGITLETVAEVAATGVDRISVGALTHSVRALDISLLILI